jgi:hypothetical protein
MPLTTSAFISFDPKFSIISFHAAFISASPLIISNILQINKTIYLKV